MTDSGESPAERWMQTIISYLLRVGVALSAALVLAGGIIYLARHGLELPDYRTFRGEPAEFCCMSGIAADAFSLRGRGLIGLGLLVLIATPVARVAFSVFSFLRLRDFKYVLVTLIVFALLLYSLFFRMH